MSLATMLTCQSALKAASEFPERGTDPLASGEASPRPTGGRKAYRKYDSEAAKTFGTQTESRFFGRDKDMEAVAEKWGEALKPTFFPNDEATTEITENIFHYTTSHLASDAASGASLARLREFAQKGLADVGVTIDDQQAWKDSFKAIASSVYYPKENNRGPRSVGTTFEPPSDEFHSLEEEQPTRPEEVQLSSAPTGAPPPKPFHPTKTQFTGTTHEDQSTKALTSGIGFTDPSASGAQPETQPSGLKVCSQSHADMNSSR